MTEGISKNKTVKYISRSILVILCLVPLVFLVSRIHEYKVDVPVWDQWDLVPVLEKAHGRNLSFQDLWEPHNEHRLLFPRIIMLVLASISGWNISYELYFSVFLAAGIFLLLAYQVKTTRASSAAPVSLWILPVISLAVFSLNQWENWLWGWNIQIMLNIFCAVGAVVFLAGPGLKRWKFIMAVLLAFVGTYSYASGMAIWFIGMLLLLLLPLPTSKKKKFVFLWGAMGTICICVYLLGYQKPPHHPSLLIFLEHPWKYFKYVSVYLGTPLLSSDARPQIAFLAGLTGLIVFITASLMLIGPYKKKLSVLLPYFALSAYALAGALLTGLGRAGFGELQAMSSRYASFSNLLWITIFFFLFFMMGERREVFTARYLFPVLAGVIIFLIIQSSWHSESLFRERKEWLLPARRELFILKNKEMWERIYPHLEEIDQEEFERRLNFLKEQKLSVFREPVH